MIKAHVRGSIASAARASKKFVLRNKPSRALAKKSASALVTGGVIVVCAGLIVTSLGVRLPQVHFPHGHATPVKTKLVAAAPKIQACAQAVTQGNSLFSNCPAFSVVYANQPQGTINSKEFTAKIGSTNTNNQAEYNTDDISNLRVQNGNLVLEARVQADGGYKYTSARIDTHGKEDFLYGKIVVRATMPKGVGTWPAIWMLPSQPTYASLKPASYLNDGEIDIAESAGVEPNVVYGIAHSVAYPENGPNRSYYKTIKVPGDDTTFHDYELDWTPTSLTFSIDGQPFYTYSKQANATWRSWPFNQPFYLVIDLALGGTWAGSDKAQYSGDGINKNALPAEMQVQSINYYSYTGAQ